MNNKVFTVADYFIAKNNKDKIGPLTNKKLQKLLYYAQAWNLVINKKKLFEDRIEAWVHGPAIPRVYAKYKNYGMQPIETKIDESVFSKELSKKEIEVLEAIWKVYGKYDADYLEQLTHSEDPWFKTRNNKASFESSNEVIPTVLMKTYYANQLR